MNFLKDLFSKQGFLKISVPIKPIGPSDFNTPMSINETMNSKYGVAWQVFLPETIRVSLKRDFNITLNEVLMNKVMATQAVMLNPYFEWDMFEKICLSFNNVVPNFEIIEPLSMLELVWGHVCVKALQPTYEPTSDIKKYTETVMRENGLVWCPWTGTEQGDPAFIDSIKAVWKSPDKITSSQEIGIQIDRLSIIADYVRSM